MPRNKRGNIKLRHDQAVSHIETATEYMIELQTMFVDVHPEYANGYANIIMMLIQAREFVLKMKEFI